MRLLRAIASVAGGITLAAVAVTGQASAAAPTSPYNTLTFNGNDSFTFDAPIAYLYPAGNGSREGIFLSAEGNQGDGDHVGSVEIFAPAGTNLTTGTFQATNNGGASQYTLMIGFDWQSCDFASGSVTINSLTRDTGGKLTSFAASYNVRDCGSEDLGYHGELRWNSTVGFVETRQAPAQLSFDSVGMGQNTAPQSATFTSTGSNPIKLGAATLKGQTDTFKVVNNGCLNVTLAYGQTCSVSVLANPQRFEQVTATLQVADNSPFGARTVQLTARGRSTNAGNYFSLTPFRILDTRDGTGGYSRSPIGPGQTLRIKADRLVGSRFAGAAVVLNVTVDSPTSAGFLTIFPAGTARPTASSLNFPAGWVGANSVTVPLGVNGQIDIFNAAGRTHVIIDEVGVYYGADDENYQWGGEYQPHNPTRLLDTREDGGRVPGFYYATVLADYGAVANPHVKALAVNITAVDPQQSGYLTAWSGKDPRGDASTLNFKPHTVVPNFAIIPASPCTIVPQCAGIPSIAILNASSGATHIVVDIVGFYDDATLGGGLRFHPLNPTRITDTREGLGAPRTLTGASTTTITAPGTVANTNTVALIANVTGVNPTNSTYLTVWPAGSQRPTASTLNLTPHEIRANASIVLLNNKKQFNVYNAAWNVDLVIDVSGTLELYPYPLPLATATTSSDALATKQPPTPRDPLVRPLH
ncbi:hypothetical protein KZZ52_58710 [Dactylosporangium sp. AC04546]|uniref:hypothetical protein n=1 Tax=Dactylosporangium sp. AC04546 TaxID=2862460 RepID=UPI001EDEAA64|nr:hypothetical protein [Dactylosporangium sp. AC04546]WVK83626.1 hypothetical protein KZZ52_58710 [Dactylosporangium sp. AC04546]